MVCYFAPLSKKWIRCIVDHIGTQREDNLAIAVLWALDYGRPLMTKNLEGLVPLAEEDKNVQSLIFAASLQVRKCETKNN